MLARNKHRYYKNKYYLVFYEAEADTVDLVFCIADNVREFLQIMEIADIASNRQNIESMIKRALKREEHDLTIKGKHLTVYTFPVEDDTN